MCNYKGCASLCHHLESTYILFKFFPVRLLLSTDYKIFPKEPSDHVEKH